MAIEYSGFGGYPAYPQADNSRTESIFVHTLIPGAIQEEGVVVVNNTASSKTLLVYAADSTPSTGGAFACEQLSEPKDDVGAWILLEKSEVMLDSGTSELVPFIITVPAEPAVGEHNGCILIQEKSTGGEQSGKVNISMRTGIRVSITISGEIKRELSITDFSVEKDGDFIFLSPQVKNTGNTSIDTDISVKINSIFGSTKKEFGGNYPVLRGETSIWNYEFKKPFWGGVYVASFTAAYDQNSGAEVGKNTDNTLVSLHSPNIRFFSAPQLPAIFLEISGLALICFLTILVLRVRKNIKIIATTWVKKKIRSGDTIQSIAEKKAISWKKIARANRIKAPYVLKSGQTIIVPPKTKR
ncbi:MAG: LysM domain-containing protein [Patescibacteria group bacterium]|jgi:hypothetical protein